MSKHPNFDRCYAEGVASQTTGKANPYSPDMDEFRFFEEGRDAIPEEQAEKIEGEIK